MTTHLNEVPRLLLDATEMEAVPSLDEVRGHRLTHHTKSDEAYFQLLHPRIDAPHRLDCGHDTLSVADDV